MKEELITASTIKPRRSDPHDLGPCPRCERERRQGRLRLITGVRDEQRYEFAACDQDTKTTRLCGYTCSTEKGILIVPVNCPTCGATMRTRRREGGHAWICSTCRGKKWFLADARWNLVRAPGCPKCGQPMTHRERPNHDGEFLWVCFDCEVFIKSDVFGAAAGRPKQASQR